MNTGGVAPAISAAAAAAAIVAVAAAAGGSPGGGRSGFIPPEYRGPGFEHGVFRAPEQTLQPVHIDMPEGPLNVHYFYSELVDEHNNSVPLSEV